MSDTALIVGASRGIGLGLRGSWPGTAGRSRARVVAGVCST